MNFYAALSTGAAAIREQLKAQAYDVALAGANYATAHCPVRTGNLRNTIRVVPLDGDSGDIGYRVVIGGADAPYAPYVIGGTEKMAANPFFYEARDAAIAHAKTVIRLGGYGRW